MIIRQECEQDGAAIRAIHIAAFANHPYSRQTEHLIVDALREAGMMAVSLVAEVDGEVVGHIAFSPAQIDGQLCGWYMAGPLGVLPERQKQGFGKALVEAGLQALRETGAQGCVLVGDAKFYERFGFAARRELFMEGLPSDLMLSIAFAEPMPQGEVVHHPAFWVTA